MYLGLDGFRHGWVAASIDGKGNGRVEFLCEVGQLDHRQYQMAMIDIPIGLPQAGNRSCDIAAREMLGANCNRVFTGARRPLLLCHSHKEANRAGQELLVDGQPGAGVPIQLFCILKKIREVDAFINPTRQETVRECHPEMVFQRLHSGPVPSKHRCKHLAPGMHPWKGLQVRRELLATYVSNLDQLIKRRIGNGAKEDDVLDAFACAVAAMDCAGGKQFVVPEGKCCLDDHGLKMQIWY